MTEKLLFYCSNCGARHCEVLGVVCADCIIQAKRREPSKTPYEGTCFYCERSLWLIEDHVVPVARGGAPEGWNIVGACHRCNGQKSDYLPSEWCPIREAALDIQRRHRRVFPRMRHGRLIGDDHGASYARTRSLCSNFLKGMWHEIDSLPKTKGSVLFAAVKSAEKLERYVDEAIRDAEAKGNQMKDQLGALKEFDAIQEKIRRGIT